MLLFHTLCDKNRLAYAIDYAIERNFCEFTSIVQNFS